jgi:hypothetical protein
VLRAEVERTESCSPVNCRFKSRPGSVLWIEVVHHPQIRDYLGAGSRPEVTATIANPEEVGDRSGIQWVSGRPGEAPVRVGPPGQIGP